MKQFTTTALLLSSILTLSSCNNADHSRETERLERQLADLQSELSALTSNETEEPATTTPEASDVDATNNLITPQGVGPFQLGEPLPKEGDFEGFLIQKKVETISTEEGPMEEIIWRVYKDDEILLELTRGFDYNTGDAIESIGEIAVLSPYFETEKGVKVGTTLTSVFNHYQNPNLWYTYISGMFVADVPALPQVQFLLDGDDYTGDRSKLGNSESDVLRVSDFADPTRIEKIRLYGL